MNIQKMMCVVIVLVQLQCTSTVQEQKFSVENTSNIEQDTIKDIIQDKTLSKEKSKAEDSQIPYLNIYKDSVPFRFLPREEQIEKSEPIHTYNNYQLKQNKIIPQQYRFLDQDQGIEIIEEHPGIVNYYFRTPMGKEEQLKIPLNKRKEKIEFYDIKTGKLLNAKVVEEENPYMKKGITKGNPNGEYHEEEGVFVSDFKSKANEFYTSGQAYTLPNGHACIQYWLYAIKDKYVLGIEMSFLVFNKRGNKIKQIDEIPYRINAIQISDDSQYVLWVGRNYFSNGEESEDIFSIYKLENMEMVYEYKPAKGTKLREAGQIENGLFKLADYREKDETRTEYFFDLKNRIKYYKSMQKEETKKVYEDFKNYSTLMKKLSFNQESF